MYQVYEQQAQVYSNKRCQDHARYIASSRNLPKTFDYRLEHVKTAVAIGGQLAAEVGVEPSLARIALWLHDIGKCNDPARTDSENAARFRDHGLRGAEEAQVFLAGIGLAPEAVGAVAHAISVHVGYVKDYLISEPLAAVVWDADKLSKISIAGQLHYLGHQLVGDTPGFSSLEAYFCDSLSPAWRQDIRNSLNLQAARDWADQEISASRIMVGEILRTLRGQRPISKSGPCVPASFPEHCQE